MGRTIDVINPATLQPVGQITVPDKEVIDASIEASAAAQGSWARTGWDRRQELLLTIADAIESEVDELSKLLTMEQGKPLAESVREIKAASQVFRHYASMDATARIIKDDDNARVTVTQQPYGVCALILPWNYPVGLFSWKLAPCLLAGNSALVKPSHHAPLTIIECARIINQTLPDRPLQVMTGDAGTGRYIASHPGIDRISFTGSQETGRAIMSSASSHVTALSLELGGNDPAIILKDCDMEKRFESIFWGCFVNAGQICIAIKRIYVHEDRSDELVRMFLGRLSKLKVGNGLDPGVEMGPLNNQAQLEKVEYMVNDAVEKGAALVCGGSRYADDARSKGYFYEPAVLTDIDPNSRLVTGEQFGPAIPLIEFNDADEAIAQANATHFGLGGSVWTENVEHGLELAEQLECGIAWLNAHMLLEYDAPFGGWKQSGIGRELGRPGLDQFLQFKTMYWKK